MLTALFGVLLFFRNKPLHPDQKVHPTRFTEAVAPYGFALGLLGMVITGIVMLLERG
jgi:hypothetical protein